MTRRLPRFVSLLLAVLFAAATYGQRYTFTTLAGMPAGSNDGSGTAARFNLPHAVAVVAGGTIYIADTDNHTIRSMTAGGVVRTLAGAPGLAGSSDGAGAAARFNSPRGIAADIDGDVYVADSENHTIRRITPQGVVTTVAGTAGQSGSTDGVGPAARFNMPLGGAVDSAGNLYVADELNHTIRRVSPEGLVTTLAGGSASKGSADGTGGTARFNRPSSVAIDPAGILYVADRGNHTIRKVTSSGVVTTLAGTPGDPVSIGSNSLLAPLGVAVDIDGALYVVDGSHTIRRVTHDGRVAVVAGAFFTSGKDDGFGRQARFAQPWGLAADGLGNVYVADTYNHTIRRMRSDRVVSTVAGVAPRGNSEGPGEVARFGSPGAVAVDPFGNIFVADRENFVIRRITPDGLSKTLAGLPGTKGNADGVGATARFSWPAGVAADATGSVYVIDGARIRKVRPDGSVTTLAGALEHGHADGEGTKARFNGPSGVAVDDLGNVYVKDYYTIRKITSAGVVTTLAGSPETTGDVDGVGKDARFYGPGGVATDGFGNVYVADSFNHSVRKITPAGVVTTIARGFQGGPLTSPYAIAASRTGTLFVTDSSDTILRITTAGVVSRVGGAMWEPGCRDGTGSVARFRTPLGIAMDGQGNLYIADASNHTIRKGILVPKRERSTRH